MIRIKLLTIFLFLGFGGYSQAANADINLLIEKLNDKDWTIRYKAAETLGSTKDIRAVGPLISALKDKEGYVRMKAAEALGNIKNPQAVEPLVIALKDSEDRVRSKAKWALESIGTPSIDCLISLLKDKDPLVRCTAAKILGEIKNVRAADALIGAFKDKDVRVQWNSIEALIKIGQAAIPNLIIVLKDKDPIVRQNASEVLAEVANERVAQLLMEAFNEKDLAIVAGAHIFFIRKGVAGAEDVLIASLDRYGGYSMALHFLNCGNSKLYAAAEKWANKYGFKVYPGGLSDSSKRKNVRWGSKR